MFDLATRRPRPALLSELRALVPIIVKLGGPQAATSIAYAIQEVGH